MDHPIVQNIVYGLRRHWLALVFLLMSVGALLGAMQFNSGQKESQEKADGDLANAQSSFVTDIPADWPAADYKPEGGNKAKADKNLARIDEFFDTASGVLVFDVNATWRGQQLGQQDDFVRYKDLRIDELNTLAASNRVQLPNTTMGMGQTNRKYHFTFGHFQTNTVLPKDQIEGLALAMHDVRNISNIFLTSNILELKGIQRARMVQLEDKERTGASLAYADDLEHYTNDAETLEGYPYRVTFVCYPEVLAAVLGRIATFPANGNGIYITRNVKIESITPGKEQRKDGDDMDGGFGGGGFGGGGFGGGGFGGAGGLGGGLGGDPEDAGGGFGGGGDNNQKKEKAGELPEASVDALAASGLGSKSAKIAIGEQLLLVELHLDIIRGLIRHADGREADEEEDEGF
jgi:hypothetical protein